VFNCASVNSVNPVFQSFSVIRPNRRQRERYRSVLPLLFVTVAMTLAGAWPSPLSAQEAPSSTCWRFAFGSWDPPLDWEKAGHYGNSGELADRVQRIRDSVFARDTSAVRNSPMMWERTSAGWSVVLFPTWWPVGVKVVFDSVRAEGREMTGQATAFVANGSQDPSRARARALRCPG